MSELCMGIRGNIRSRSIVLIGTYFDTISAFQVSKIHVIFEEKKCVK